MIRSIHEWFLTLGPSHGVDPLVFGAIYVGAIPLFALCMVWLLRNVKQRRPIVWPVILGFLTFSSSYIYIFVAGKNLPWWAYALVLLVLSAASYATLKSLRKKVAREIADEHRF